MKLRIKFCLCGLFFGFISLLQATYIPGILIAGFFYKVEASVYDELKFNTGQEMPGITLYEVFVNVKSASYKFDSDRHIMYAYLTLDADFTAHEKKCKKAEL